MPGPLGIAANLRPGTAESLPAPTNAAQRRAL